MDTAKNSEFNEQTAKLREEGKLYIMTAGQNKKKMKKGLSLLMEACNQNDPEALFIMAKLTLESALLPIKGNREQNAMKLLFRASEYGSLQARAMLTDLCMKRYEKDFQFVKDKSSAPHPLTDFQGNKITIQRKGLFTPIDANLEFVEGKNILTFRCDLDLFNRITANDPEKYQEAVIKGIKAWEGEYQVFGGQQLTVKIDVTTKGRLIDSVHIFMMNKDGRELLGLTSQVAEKLGQDKAHDVLKSLETKENSFSVVGKKWTVQSKKTIFINTDDSNPENYEEISQIVTHEFGHALGLGDLYTCPQKGMEGVNQGEYQELDSYYIANKCYQLIMCTHHGIISNNDIEMIVLAFSENAGQYYQKDNWRNTISEALGQGN